jgi:putative transposase
VRDAELKERIEQVYTSNYRVYGARKIWRELNRQGHEVARCTVERLMRELGIQGAVRGKRVITTVPGGQVERAPDLTSFAVTTEAPGCAALDRGLMGPGKRRHQPGARVITANPATDSDAAL